MCCILQEVKQQDENNSDLVVDVDEELQNELCKLWDMSMNSVSFKLHLGVFTKLLFWNTQLFFLVKGYQ